MERMQRRKNDAAVTSDLCHRFGAIAVHMNFVTSDEMKAGVLAQIDDDINGREHRLLGTILHDRGLLTEQQIDMVLQELKKHLE